MKFLGCDCALGTSCIVLAAERASVRVCLCDGIIGSNIAALVRVQKALSEAACKVGISSLIGAENCCRYNRVAAGSSQ